MLCYNMSVTRSRIRGVKRNNGVFIIPLFLLKNFRYSIIPAQKVSSFFHSIIPPKKAHIIPLFQVQNFRYSYPIIPLQPPIGS